MEIKKLNSIHQNKLFPYLPQTQRVNFAMPKDTFERSEVSFGAKKNKNNCKPNYNYQPFLDEVVVRYAELENKNLEEELEMFTYLAVVYSKSVQDACKRTGIYSLDDINKGAKNAYTPVVKETLDEVGFTDIRQLNKFMMRYNSNPEMRKAFTGQDIEALKIYGLLEEKSHFERYGDILLCLYNREKDNGCDDFSCINEIGAFLKSIDVKDSADFDKKFSHLAPKFNDFENMSDRLDAIEYIKETHGSKIEFLNSIISNVSNGKKYKAEKVYYKLAPIIDYLYEKNNGTSLEDLDSYFTTIIDGDKVRKNARDTFAILFNNFETPKDEVEFYKTLKEYSITPNDLNCLVEESVLTGIESIDYFFIFDDVKKIIQEINGQDEKTAKQTFIDFKDILTVLYNGKDDDIDNIKNFLELADKFNIKNSEAFLNFYNKANNTKLKNLAPDEALEFIELLEYSPSKTILEDARKQRRTAVAILKARKEECDNIKKEIDAFLLEDKTGYFAGKTSDDIYKEYGKILGNDTAKISSVLNRIIHFEIEDSIEYKEKSQKVDEFSKFFENREETLKFISNNKIKLDNSEQDNTYIQNCLTILNAISKNSNPEDRKTRLEFYSNSSFLPASSKTLDDFLKGFNEKERNIVINKIADKELWSLNELNLFAKKYKDKEIDEVLDFMLNLPDGVTFQQGCDSINALSILLSESNIPVEITTENLNRIDIDLFNGQRRLNANALNKILSGILDVEENACFISGLPNSTTTEHKYANKYKIAEEIVSKMDKSDESYQNLIKQLGVDLESLKESENCSSYILIKAVSEALPDNFIKFVNSDEWLKFDDNEGSIPNLNIHARLRLIDRYIINDDTNIDELNTDENKNKLKKIVKAIYTEPPTAIKCREKSKRYIINTMVDNKTVETVLTNEGEIITIVPRRIN